MYGTWFYKLPKRQYHLVVLKNKIVIKTIKFYSATKYYFTKLYKYAMPVLAAEMSLLMIIIKRMIVGAGVGFKKYLRVKGVGYKFEFEHSILTAKVGYTHVIRKKVPSEFFFQI